MIEMAVMGISQLLPLLSVGATAVRYGSAIVSNGSQIIGHLEPAAKKIGSAAKGMITNSTKSIAIQ